MFNHDKASPLHDLARLAQLKATGLLDSPADPSFDRLARLATRFLGTPVALVSLVDADRQFFKACVGLPEPWATNRQTPLSHSFCQYVVTSGEPLVINDAYTDPRFRDNPAISDLGVVAYLGIPITFRGQVLGSFCAIDTEPRVWLPDDVATMTDLAESVVSEIRLRTETAEHEQLRLETENARGVAETARQNLEVTLASISDAVIATDAAGDVTFINSAACYLTGWAAKDAAGAPIEQVFNIVEEKSGRSLARFVEHVLATGVVSPWRNHTILIARDGGRREIEESAAPILLGEQIVGAVVTFRNVGPRKEQAKLLEDSKALLDSMLAAGDIRAVFSRS